MSVKSAHDGISVSELIEVRSEDCRVKEAVLAIQVDCIILHRSSGQDKFVLCLVAQFVHRFGLLCIVTLNSLAFIADDHVCVPFIQCVKDAFSPCGFVIDNGYL